MDVEDVVHVLRRVHKSLRPHGDLVDVHPQPQHAWVEVERGGRRHRLGLLDDTVGIQIIRDARKRLSSVMRDGLFVVRARRYFDWEAHYSTVDSWLRRREEYGEWTSVIPPALLRRARREMRTRRTTLVVGEPTRAVAFSKRD